MRTNKAGPDLKFSINNRNDSMSDIWARCRERALPGWETHLYESSVVLRSADRTKVVSVTHDLVVKIDTKAGTEWRTAKFTCPTLDAAWQIANQTMKAHRNATTVH